MIKIYIAKDVSEQIKKEPVPAVLVAYADLVDAEKKLSKAKQLLKSARKFTNPQGFLAYEIEEFLKKE